MAKIIGLEELDVALQQFAGRVTGEALLGITQAAAAVIQPEIVARAPQRTGNLKDAIESVSELPSPSHATTTVQVADSAPGGANHYAVFEEFGTVKTQPHSFVRLGFEVAKEAAMAAAANRLIDTLKRTS